LHRAFKQAYRCLFAEIQSTGPLGEVLTRMGEVPKTEWGPIVNELGANDLRGLLEVWSILAEAHIDATLNDAARTRLSGASTLDQASRAILESAEETRQGLVDSLRWRVQMLSRHDESGLRKQIVDFIAQQQEENARKLRAMIDLWKPC